MQGNTFPVPLKLWCLACALLGVFLVQNVLWTLLPGVLALCALAAQRKWRIVRSFGVFYLLLLGLLLLIRYKGLRMVIFSEFYVLMFFNLMPVFLVAWDLLATPPGELSAFLSRLHTPTPVILGLLVIFRFFPTMRVQWRGVWQSMRNRQLIGIRQIALHPIATCEYVLVPLLLRCLQISDQLSVSAVTRGAQAPGIRGSYYGKSLQAGDWLWGCAWAAGLVVLLALGGVK